MNALTHNATAVPVDLSGVQGWSQNSVAELRSMPPLPGGDGSCNLTVLIEKRALLRDCIVRGLSKSRLEGRVQAFASVDEWLGQYNPALCQSPLLVISTEDRNAAELKEDCLRIGKATGYRVPIVLLAEDEATSDIVVALNDGVRGYIPTTVPLRIAVEAMELVRAGGVFIPAHSFMRTFTGADDMRVGHDTGCGPHALFSGRQAAVVLALRRGTSNKIIAHELQMAEGTVKVHVRNIMRKLKAQNRTHAAFLLNELDAVRR